MSMSEENTARQAGVRRAEIRKLVEEVQQAVASGRLRFGAELDRRILEQYRRNSMEQDGRER
jgi:hypothetical protein